MRITCRSTYPACRHRVLDDALLSANNQVYKYAVLAAEAKCNGVVCDCRRRSRSRDRVRGSEVPPPSSLYSGSRRPGREREREFRR